MIDNINSFVKNPTICLHVSPIFKDFDLNRMRRKDNVIVNVDRYYTRQFVSRIPPYLSNKMYAIREGCFFDYEIFFFPKMLFIRGGIEDYLSSTDACFHAYPSQKADMGDDKEAFDSLLEGICISRDVSDRMYATVMYVPQLLKAAGHCPEEVIFPTLIKDFSKVTKKLPMSTKDDRPSGTTIKMVKSLLTSEIEQDLFYGERKCCELFMAKNFLYDANSEARKFVRDLAATERGRRLAS